MSPNETPIPVGDEVDSSTGYGGCVSCHTRIPIHQRRRLRMVEHDQEPELCLTCRSDRAVKRQCGGAFLLRHDGLNRKQRRQVAQERECARRHEATRERLQRERVYA